MLDSERANPRRFASSDTLGSIATSTCEYASPEQTLLFLDWDDTLFPTTELIYRRHLLDSNAPVPEGLDDELSEWLRAATDLLSSARALSGRCVVLTNAKAPWVHSCLETFAPELKPLFDADDPEAISIVYATDVVEQVGGRPVTGSSYCLPSCLVGCLRFACSSRDSLLEEAAQAAKEDMTWAKLVAMEVVAEDFYSRYPGQTWKNLLSVGDALYEREALSAVSQRRAALAQQLKERLKAKSITTPEGPTIGDLTLCLRLLGATLEGCVQYNGSFEANLQRAPNPVHVLAGVLAAPALRRVDFPCLEEAEAGEEKPHVSDELLDEIRSGLSSAAWSSHLPGADGGDMFLTLDES